MPWSVLTSYDSVISNGFQLQPLFMCVKPSLFLLYFLFGNCKEVILNKLEMGSSSQGLHSFVWQEDSLWPHCGLCDLLKPQSGMSFPPP